MLSLGAKFSHWPILLIIIVVHTSRILLTGCRVSCFLPSPRVRIPRTHHVLLVLGLWYLGRCGGKFPVCAFLLAPVVAALRAWLLACEGRASRSVRT